MAVSSSATTITLAAIAAAQVIVLAYIAMLAARYTAQARSKENKHLVDELGASSPPADLTVRHELSGGTGSKDSDASDS